MSGMRGFAYDLRNVTFYLSEALCTKQMQVRESSWERVVVGKEQTDCKFASNLNASSSCRQRTTDCKLQAI